MNKMTKNHDFHFFSLPVEAPSVKMIIVLWSMHGSRAMINETRVQIYILIKNDLSLHKIKIFKMLFTFTLTTMQQVHDNNWSI